MCRYLGGVSVNGGARESLVYILVAVVVVVIIVFAVVFSGRSLKSAYVPNDFLDAGWSEDLFERDSGSSFFGLESWYSITYKTEGLYPASLTVSTYKTLFMMNEDELRDKTTETIWAASQQGIVVVNGTKIFGERFLKNGHNSIYIVYDGEDTSKDPVEKIKVVGEVWNCGVSGTSIICIGVAQVTDNLNNNTAVNTTSWKKIISGLNGEIEDFTGDDGLIYNVVCH